MTTAMSTRVPTSRKQHVRKMIPTESKAAGDFTMRAVC
eukprot:CAMPEP_0174364892 /NCGR_PEP_ID=MMETSP0811_2-20130205/74967_1 /TAXON_ID=73025 ORGANISM="Eutreptiella gymnastica-like, Strain CCMP1594" /NCGR_SAMPLE_ID=MMETSP0811_2 /ASSEMBLY_ACC=CAM_ASM_000667 /LENGTH=37 /DNA_ID= /DNA_START= /DNA_END= /DNA_ORIENTATION=